MPIRTRGTARGPHHRRPAGRGDDAVRAPSAIRVRAHGSAREVSSGRHVVGDRRARRALPARWSGRAPHRSTPRSPFERGQRVAYELAWARPYDDVPPPLDIDEALHDTETFWKDWTSRIRLPPEYDDLVMRSLITLKALHLPAERRDRRGADVRSPGDAGRRAQLGLSLHVDPRLRAHAERAHARRA